MRQAVFKDVVMHDYKSSKSWSKLAVDPRNKEILEGIREGATVGVVLCSDNKPGISYLLSCTFEEAVNEINDALVGSSDYKVHTIGMKDV
jgi:hypothetical protein